jgi:hypothetical protein
MIRQKNTIIHISHIKVHEDNQIQNWKTPKARTLATSLLTIGSDQPP